MFQYICNFLLCLVVFNCVKVEGERLVILWGIVFHRIGCLGDRIAAVPSCLRVLLQVEHAGVNTRKHDFCGRVSRYHIAYSRCTDGCESWVCPLARRRGFIINVGFDLRFGSPRRMDRDGGLFGDFYRSFDLEGHASGYSLEKRLDF